MDLSREEGGVEPYGITTMSGGDFNSHDPFDSKQHDDDDGDDEMLDADDESNPLLKTSDSSEDTKEADDDGKFLGISKSLIPFYGVYKLITKSGPYPLLVLLLLLLAYLHNQLIRYTLPVTAPEVAGDLHYGNQSCVLHRDQLDNITSYYPNNVSGQSIDDWTDHCASSKLK